MPGLPDTWRWCPGDVTAAGIHAPLNARGFFLSRSEEAPMKVKLTFALAALACTLTLADLRPTLSVQTAITPQQCASFCMRALCFGQKCGLHTDSTGQTVCGCY